MIAVALTLSLSFPLMLTTCSTCHFSRKLFTKPVKKLYKLTELIEL